MDRVCRVYGYLRRYRHGINRIDTEEPDFSDLPKPSYDWKYSIYDVEPESIPSDAPRPLGKPIVMSHYLDANLLHDLVNGKAMHGMLHMWNKTVIDWYSKLQPTVEDATYGAELVATKTGFNQIVDLRTTAMYLGDPLKGNSIVFGDNESVVNSTTIPQGKLTKRHHLLSFHRARSLVANGTVNYWHIAGKVNPADILSKHWAMYNVWDTLKPLLFWRDSDDHGEHETKPT